MKMNLIPNTESKKMENKYVPLNVPSDVNYTIKVEKILQSHNKIKEISSAIPKKILNPSNMFTINNIDDNKTLKLR